MTRPLIIRHDAESDIARAFRWYQKRSPGRGVYFLQAVEDTLTSVARDPDLYAKVYRDARRALLRGFPYAVFYILRPDLVEVIGCLHTRRHTRRWRSRL